MDGTLVGEFLLFQKVSLTDVFSVFPTGSPALAPREGLGLVMRMFLFQVYPEPLPAFPSFVSTLLDPGQAQGTTLLSGCY